MDQFLNNLKREAEANPTMAIVATAGLLTALSQVIKAVGDHKGQTAYAKYAKIAEKKAKNVKK